MQRWQAGVDTSPVPSNAGALWRVKAAERLRAVADALGPLASGSARPWWLHDVPRRQLGETLGVHAETAQARAVEAVAALTLHLAAGEPVPPTPRAR